MKYVLIGCGRISPNHIMAAKKNNLEFSGICDINPEKIKEKAEKFNLEDVKQYTDYKEMIAKEKPDIAAITTESGKHAKIAINCLNAGVNVIIEKPIALSLKDADEIINTARAKNLKVCTSHQNRFNRSIQKIREAIEQKRFGKLFYAAAHIRWHRDINYYSAAKWRGTWEQDGGALMNQCIHNIDLLRWLMGSEIESVTGITDKLNHPYIQCEDLGLAIVKFKNGSYGLIEGTTDIYKSNLEETLYIFGEKGTVKAGGQSVNKIEVWNFADNIDNPDEIISQFSENPPNIYGFGHTPLYADMIDAVKNNREPYINAEDGKRALELVLAIYKSSFEGKTINLPLKECSTLDFSGRFD